MIGIGMFVEGAVDFQNPDFEYGVANNTVRRFLSAANNWQTTSYIEVWGNGFLNIPAYTGTNYIQLNSPSNIDLYQDILLLPKTKYEITFVMRSFQADSGQYIDIELNGVVRASFENTGNADWVEVTYQFYTANTIRWRIAIRGYNTVSDQAGNFLDAMHITAIYSEILCHSNNPNAKMLGGGLPGGLPGGGGDVTVD